MQLPPFAALLRQHMEGKNRTPDQLSKRTGIPKATIVHWRNGDSGRPRDEIAILKIAIVLELSEEETTELLRSAGHPSAAVLRERLRDELGKLPAFDQKLLKPWLEPSQPSGAKDAEILDAALRQLASMPLDTIPAPAPLPHGSRMPLHRNPLFVGRESDFVLLARALKGGEIVSIGQIAAATGMGGIGKTQLAVEFVHRYGQFFLGGVFWLSFADPNAVPSQVAACGGIDHLKLQPNFADLSLDDQIKLVRAAWQAPIPRLLVFDNCEDQALLKRWLPTSGGCRVLITSRRIVWDATLGVQTLALDVLPRAESIALLHKHLPDRVADDPVLDQIAAELGDLPLALHLAGSYLARYRHVVTPTSYLEQLRRAPPLDHLSLHGADHSPTKHIQHVARTFALSYNRLDPQDAVDQLALALLARAAYFAPGEAIPRDLLIATLDSANTERTPSLTTEDALARLAELGLVTTETGGAIRLHRLVIMFVQQRIAGAEAQTAVEQTLVAQANQLNEAGDTVALRPWQTHLRFVTDTALQRMDEPASDLAEATGHHLWLLSEHVEAQRYLEQALAIREQLSNPLKRGACFNLLGLTNQMQSHFEQAQSMFEQALAIWQQCLPADHENIDAEHTNLGHLLMTMNQFAASQFHYRQALAIHRRTHPTDKVGTARIINNLGYLFLLQGSYRAAVRYLKLALKIREHELSSPHMALAQSLNNVGEALYLLGDYDNAWAYHERSLAMRRTIFGDQHHDVAESYFNFGRILQAQGQYEEARSYFAQAYEINEATLGPENYETTVMLETLGSALCDLHEYDEARRCLEKALSMWNRTVGLHHVRSAATLDHLGLLFLTQSDDEQARGYLQQALTIRQELLGADHPDIAHSLFHLGQLHSTQGNLGAARYHFEQALAIALKRLGKQHPFTRQVQASHAALDIKPDSPPHALVSPSPLPT